jgi:hypothetical protein
MVGCFALQTDEYLPTFKRSGELFDPNQRSNKFLHDVDEHLPDYTVYSTIKPESSNK